MWSKCQSISIYAYDDDLKLIRIEHHSTPILHHMADSEIHNIECDNIHIITINIIMMALRWPMTPTYDVHNDITDH